MLHIPFATCYSYEGHCVFSYSNDINFRTVVSCIMKVSVSYIKLQFTTRLNLINNVRTYVCRPNIRAYIMSNVSFIYIYIYIYPVSPQHPNIVHPIYI